MVASRTCSSSTRSTMNSLDNEPVCVEVTSQSRAERGCSCLQTRAGLAGPPDGRRRCGRVVAGTRHSNQHRLRRHDACSRRLRSLGWCRQSQPPSRRSRIHRSRVGEYSPGWSGLAIGSTALDPSKARNISEDHRPCAFHVGGVIAFFVVG